MAVVPMEKVRLLVYAKDVDAALDVVQRDSALEFKSVNTDEDGEEVVFFPNEQLLPRVQHVVNFLSEYAPEISLWRKLREGTRVALTEEGVKKRLSDTDAVELVVKDVEALQVEFAELNEKIDHLAENYERLLEWKDLPLRLADFKTKRTETVLIKGGAGTPKTVGELVSDKLTDAEVPHSIMPLSDTHVAVALPKEIEETKLSELLELEANELQIVTPPEGKETPEVELVAVLERLSKARGEKALLIDQAEHFAISHLRNLQVAAEILSWQQARFATVKHARKTKYVLVFEGWLNANKKAVIEADFKKNNTPAVFTKLEPEEGEEPPVEIENSPLIRPFEAVTRLYGMPGYHDLDPTPFLAAFFFLFFGMSLTDVGYGLALVVASIFILRFTKATEATKSFAKLLLYIGIATVLVGMLFGGYFGVSPDKLPPVLQKLQMFDPIGDPLPVFYLALALGVFQVMVGMIIKIYSEYKNGRLLNGLMDEGPWLFTFGVGILYVLNSINYVNVPENVIAHLAILGAVLIVIFSGRNGEGIIGKIISALAGLYAGVGHFSDVLSYSRLLALGLATSALAFAVNLIAGMVVDVPYLGFILAAAILLVGHLFTLAINTLGAFVHSARLQFVEFFGKFITGTGKEFKPLSRTENYVTIVDD